MANRGSTRTGGRGDPGHRPTKAERKEMARLERERIQKQMRARRRRRNIGLSLMAVAVATVVVAVFLSQPDNSGAGLPTPADLLSRAKDDAATAGCTKVEQVRPYGNDSDQTHIGTGDPRFVDPPPLFTYPSTPPASGPHDGVPLPHGSYDSPPSVPRTIHSLEHSAAIIWYAPDAPGELIDQIKDFYSQDENVGQAKVIVAPYDYPDEGSAGVLPRGAQMALVAWHEIQTCTQPSLSVAFNFTSQYSNAYPGGTYIGLAPEPNNFV